MSQNLTLKYKRISEEDYDVKVVRERAEDKPRLLIILDHVPKEDLKIGRLLSGHNGKLLFNIFETAEEFYKAPSLDDFDWLVVNYNQCKTYGLPQEEQDDYHRQFDKRLRYIVKQYKPDHVISFGDRPAKALFPKKFSAYDIYATLGQPVSTKLYGKKTTVTSTLSLNFIERNAAVNSYLLGYMARNVANGVNGRNPYAIKQSIQKQFKTKLLNDMPSIRKMFKQMSRAKYVAIDTETTNLNKAIINCLTVQYCYDGKTTYVIPVRHKDSRLSSSDLIELGKLNARFFEGRNKNKYHVYTNGKFDLSVLKATFPIRHFHNKIWDIQAGEFANDENMKVLTNLKVSGRASRGGYYGLGNLAHQFGCTLISDNTFGKSQRTTIKDHSLTGGCLNYCGLDCTIPYHIMLMQRKRARAIGHDMYDSLVSEQIGDQIHAFHILEHTGALTDIEYLFKLNLPNSTVNDQVAEAESKILRSKAVAKANKILSKDKGIPTQGLLGNVTPNIFDLSKEEHKQVLFFDVLKLKPISVGKAVRENGKATGKLDKDFQEKYKDNPIVKAYAQLQKVYKLRNAYIRSFIKRWANDEDFYSTKRMRPDYSFFKVVTGRTSSSDPNLQQIPSRSELAKLIKRLFVADKNNLLIKVDYSAHEVRCWSLISGDAGVAKAFQVGADMRKLYKLKPSKELADRISKEGDIHMINAAYFFGLDIVKEYDKVKAVRNDVKKVIFGLIYQQSLGGLAKSIGKSEAEVKRIVDAFLDRFPTGVKWFDLAKEVAAREFYIESPVGRRRHLWAYMLPKAYPGYEGVIRTANRRAVNSPVQGYGSDLMMIGLRRLDQSKFEYFKRTGYYPKFKLTVSVHDSVTVEVPYKEFWIAIDLIDKALAPEVAEVVKSRVKGYQFLSNPEIDFEIGSAESNVKGWDYSYDGMQEIVHKALIAQKEDHKYKVDPEKICSMIMRDYKNMPDFMKKQLWLNKKQKVISLEKFKNPVTKRDKAFLKNAA